MTAPSWAEARKVEEDAREELAYQERQLGGHNSALRDVAKNAALTARRASDVALVRRVLEHVRSLASRESLSLLTARDMASIDPSAVLAEIEKEEG